MSRTSSNWHQRATWGMAIGLIVALALLLVLRPGILGGLSTSFEYDTLDFWCALREARRSNAVVVVAIDEATLRRWQGDSFRAPDVARAVTLLGQAGAGSVALDLPQLCDPGLHFEGETALVRAIKANGRVVLPLEMRPLQGAGTPVLQGASRWQIAQSQQSARRFSLAAPFKNGAPSGQTPGANQGNVAAQNAAKASDSPRGVWTEGVEVLPAARWRLAAPSRALLDVAAGAGHLNFALDRFGRARRLPLYIGFEGRFYPAFSAAATRVAQSFSAEQNGRTNRANASRENGNRQNANRQDANLKGTNRDKSKRESATRESATRESASRENVKRKNADLASERTTGENARGENAASERGARAANRDENAVLAAPFAAPEAAPLLNYPYGARDEAGGETAPDLVADNEDFSAFPTVSLAAILDNPGLLKGLRGRAVVIGVTAAGAATRTSTPLGNRISNAELQAVALDNGLTNRPLRRAPEVWHWLFTILPGVIVGGFSASRRPTWSGPVALLCVLSVALASIGLFWQDIWLDTSVPWLTIALTFLIGVIGRSRRQERENTHIASTVEALTRVSDLIAAQTRQLDLLDRVCHFATTVLGATGASALTLDAKSQTLTFAAALGPNSQQLIGQTLRLGEGIAGHVAQSGEVALVHEARGDSRFTSRIDAQLGLSTHNILCVPLRVRGRILGVIEVVNRENGAAFTPADAEMLQAVANQAAIALENARLYERLAQRVERSQSALAVANKQLLADKNLLQTVLHSMTDGIVVTDAAGCVQLLNPASGMLMPELSRSVVGQNLALILEDFPLAHWPECRPHEDGRLDETVLLYRGDRDAPRFIEARAAPLQSEDGALAGVVAVFADITQRKNIEQAKSDFVSFVAHEMRSPLTSISGFSAMLQRSENAAQIGGVPLPATSRARFLGLIHEESERLTRLINNLLDVAKLEAGRSIELNRGACDFARLADTALESQRTYSSRHTLRRDVPPDLPLVYADADKVTQILINLLSNALKYSPGGVVTLGALVKNGLLEVSVSDQGPGIAPEQRELLFSRFGRAPGEAQGAGSRAKPTGTGLGLFLTKHLVESHGGQIWVESETGRGATFRFSLPLADQ